MENSEKSFHERAKFDTDFEVFLAARELSAIFPMSAFCRAAWNATEPHLPPELFSSRALALLRETAPLLVPVAAWRAGFEIRLNENDDRVDLQQWVVARPEEIAALETHLTKLASTRGAAPDCGWAALLRFCRHWRETPQNIHETWLEYDVTGDHFLAPPSLFIGLEKTLSAAAQSETIAAATRVLAADFPAASLQRALQNQAFASGAARVGHAGFMLSRKNAPLRLVLQRARYENASALLQSFGWNEEAAQDAARAIEELETVFDEVRPCLDVEENGADETRGVGLECFLKEKSPQTQRLAIALDWLAKNALCTRKRAAALLAWPGIIAPTRAASARFEESQGAEKHEAAWPARWICDSLLAPQDEFVALARLHNHIKVRWQNGALHEAKSYFGLVRQFWKAPGDAAQKEAI